VWRRQTHVTPQADPRQAAATVAAGCSPTTLA
jgi:hypothetical protein